MLFIFNACEQAISEHFAETGEVITNPIRGDIDTSKLSKEERKTISHLLKDGTINVSSWVHDFVMPDLEGRTDLYHKGKFRASGVDPEQAIRELVTLIKNEDENKAAQEAEWFEKGYYKRSKQAEFANSDVARKVKTEREARRNEVIASTAKYINDLPEPKDGNVLPLKIVGQGTPVDFSATPEFEEFRENYNRDVQKHYEAEREEKRRKTEQQIDELHQWAEQNGSDLLKSRIENGYSWQEQAIRERLTALIGPIVELEYSEETVGVSSPALKEMERENKIAEMLPDWARVSIVSVEDGIGETRRLYEVYVLLGDTRMELYFN